MLRKRGGSLSSSKTDPKNIFDLENYYKSLKKNLIDNHYEFQIKKKEKNRSLIVNVKDRQFIIFKSTKSGQKKHIKRFSTPNITRVTKDKVNNKLISIEILLPTKKKKQYEFLFQSTERRESFYELIWVDKLGRDLPEKDTKVTHERIQIFVATWNMGDAQPPTSLDSWISKETKYDLVVIGVQECEYSPRDNYKDCEGDWFKTLESHLGPDYIVLESTSLVKMRIIVFSRRQHQFKFNYIEKTTIPTGIGGVYGNKGATLISFQFLESSFCFINSHFAAHQEKIEARNSNYRDIVKNSDLGYESMDILNQFTHVFWMGDFNYRIDLFREEVLLNIKKKNLNKLLAADQLLHQKSQQKVFYNFKEAPITFYPTYKMDRGVTGVYSEEKQRVPSWCDRILYKSLPYSQAITPLVYTSAPQILTSDHRPVYGVFETYIQNPCLPLPPSMIKKCSILFNDLRAENLDLVGENQDKQPDPYLVFNSCSFIETEISTACASKNRNPNWGDIPPIHPMNNKQSFLETQHLFLSIFHNGSSQVKIGHATIPLALGFQEKPFDFATRITRNGMPSGILYGKIQIIYSTDNISSPKFNLVPLKTIKISADQIPSLSLAYASNSAPATPYVHSPPPLPRRSYLIRQNSVIGDDEDEDEVKNQDMNEMIKNNLENSPTPPIPIPNATNTTATSDINNSLRKSV